MEVPDDTQVLNLCGAWPSPAVLAQIATYLESGRPLLITNAAIPAKGPGMAAFYLGIQVERIGILKDEDGDNGR